MSTATASKAAQVTTDIANVSKPVHNTSPVRRRLTSNQSLLRLQRKCGCGGTCSECTPKRIQTKAMVGPVNDPFEREADAVADRIMRMPQPQVQRACASCEVQRQPTGSDVPPSPSVRSQFMPTAGSNFSTLSVPVVQRNCSGCEEDKILRKVAEDGAGHVSPSVDRAIRAERGRGEPMPAGLRNYFEPRFGADFGSVRLHSDSRAAALALAVGAHAFTIRNDIFFASGQYQPGTAQGRRLLAHELTHTIQQGQGPAVGLQRQMAEETETEEITEEGAKKEIEGDQEGEFDDMSPDETEAAGTEEEAINEKKLGEEAAAATDVSTDEVEIPDFEMGTGGTSCVALWKEEPEKEEEEEEEEEGIDEAVFEKLMSLVPSGGFAGALPRYLASKAWGLLPLSVRTKAINLAIDAALKGVSVLPGEILVGLLWPWFQAGITGFLTKLRNEADAKKVALFEKFAGIVLGLNTKAQLGFAIGVVKGFFIDGLLGIVQMILDMLCFVPRALHFIERFIKFLSNLPEHMEAAWVALKELAMAVKAAIGGALSELKDLITNPKRIVDLFAMILEAGKTKSKEIGENIADAFLKFASLPSKKIGEKAGRIVGQFVFEAALTYLTAGAGAGISALKVGAREAVKWVVQLGKKFFEIVKKALPILEDIANVVVRAVKYLTKLFKTVCEKLNQAIQRIIDFFYSILGLCKKGSFKCKIPRHSKKPPADKTKCRGKFVPRLGGHLIHDAYARRVTGRAQDFRIVLGKARRCTFDAKIVTTLVECKTGYGWLQNPTVQSQPWFPWAKAALRGQSLRCLATAVSCGFDYEWYVQNKAAAAYLSTYFAGVPRVLHKP